MQVSNVALLLGKQIYSKNVCYYLKIRNWFIIMINRRSLKLNLYIQLISGIINSRLAPIDFFIVIF